MAHNVLWTWAWPEPLLCGYRLEPEADPPRAESVRELRLGLSARPDFSSTPAYDGVCVNTLIEGKFLRVHARDGALVGRVLEDQALPLHGPGRSPCG